MTHTNQHFPSVRTLFNPGGPQGYRNTPAYVNSHMIQVVIDIPEASCFVDDVWASSTTIEDNLARLRTLFQKMEERQMFLNLAKCEFFKSKIYFLGYKVSVRGLEPMTDRVSALTSFQNQRTLELYGSFLGQQHLIRNLH